MKKSVKQWVMAHACALVAGIVVAEYAPRTDAISINFVGAAGDDGQMSSYASADLGAYPVMGAYWNDCARGNAGTVVDARVENLKESVGNESALSGTAGAEISASSHYAAWIKINGVQYSPVTPNGRLLFGYISDGANPKAENSGYGASLKVTDIPYTKYDVYVYYGSDKPDGTRLGQVDINGTKYPQLASGVTAWGDTKLTREIEGAFAFEESGNYIHARGLSGSTLDLKCALQVGNYGANAVRSCLAAVQIVNTGFMRANELLEYALTQGETRVAEEKVKEYQRVAFDLAEGATAATVDLGVLRPTGALTLGSGVNLSLALENPAEEVVLNATGLTAENLIVRDGGKTLTPAELSVDTSVEGVVRVSQVFPVWTNAAGDAAFDNAENWSTRTVPSGGYVTIRISGDTVLAVANQNSYVCATISGNGNLSFDGTLVADEIHLSAGVTNVITANEIASRLTGEGAVVLRPGRNGIKWNQINASGASLDSKIRVVTSFVDVEGLSAGDAIPLVYADDGSVLTEGMFDFSQNGSRFAIALNDAQTALVATMRSATNFMHLDFDGDGMGLNGMKAADSTYLPNAIHFDSSFTSECVFHEEMYQGKAVKVYDKYRPHWTGLAANVSPLYAGVATLTMCLKSNTENPGTTIPVLTLGGYYGHEKKSLLLAMKTDSTLSVVYGKEDKTTVELATISNIEKWTTKYHFIVVTLTPTETILQVDDRVVKGRACPSFETDAVGCFGRTYGGPDGIGAIASNSFWIDDFRIYDAVLTQTEIDVIRNQFFPKGTVMIIR